MQLATCLQVQGTLDPKPYAVTSGFRFRAAGLGNESVRFRFLCVGFACRDWAPGLEPSLARCSIGALMVRIGFV